jgi:hypothetical protein
LTHAQGDVEKVRTISSAHGHTGTGLPVSILWGYRLIVGERADFVRITVGGEAVETPIENPQAAARAYGDVIADAVAEHSVTFDVPRRRHS